MKSGTLSEKRTLTAPINTDQASPEVKTTLVKKTVITTEEENKTPAKEPLLTSKPQLITTTQQPKPKPEHVKDTKCMYCKAEAISTLAIRGGIVLVLLALCFNLIKSATK